MPGEKSSKLYWFLPSLSDVLFILILAVILNTGGTLLGDADTGYHIRAGEYIISNLQVPHHDIFSHITPAPEWTAHEWLSEVIFALIHKISGLSGIVVATALLIAATFWVLFKFLKSSGSNVVVAALVVALAAGVSTIHWLARPHIFSLLLTLLWYIILDTYQIRRKNYLYLLPILMILWVNLHGGFITGFMLLAVYIAGNFLKAIFVKEERLEAAGRLKVLVLFSFFCLLATLLNPQGYRILLFPFELISNRFIMDNVNEFLSPNFHTDLRFEYMLLLMIFVFGVSVLRLSAIEAMLVLLFTHMSLFSARYIPLYAIILTPIMVRRIDGLVNEFKEKRLIKRFLSFSGRAAMTDSRANLHLWPFLAVGLVTGMMFTGNLHFEFNKKKDPMDAVRFLKKEKITGNMFDNDEFGDYIIYAAWPDYRVMFDGRSDMYGEKRIKEYFKVAKISAGWDEILRKYNVGWIIYNANSALSNFLLERNDWKLIYADKIANIFVRNTPEYQPLINKYPNVKPVVVKDEEEKK